MRFFARDPKLIWEIVEDRLGDVQTQGVTRLFHREVSDSELIPVRMCNEFVYCPRLFHLEHVQGLWQESDATIQGKAQHERASKRGRARKTHNHPEASKTIILESAELGVRGKVDLFEEEDGELIILEAKRGAAPREAAQAWGEFEFEIRARPEDIVQVGLYMALLRESGTPTTRARLYYRKDRSHADVPWSPKLERFVHAVVRSARAAAAGPAPEPLRDSPKCFGCSLADTCMPDEHLALNGDGPANEIRPLVSRRSERVVLHVATPGSRVRKEGEALRVEDRDGQLGERRLIKDLDQVALFGRVALTQPCTQLLLRNDISISHHTGSGRLLGFTAPLATRNIALRRAQYRAADDSEMPLTIARALVIAKLRNQRTLLRRYRRSSSDATALSKGIHAISAEIRGAQRASNLDELRGHEGFGARSYFDVWPLILPKDWRGDFAGRTRRPPRDRVNAMLGMTYSLLVRDATAALARVGLDPMLGFLHTMIAGRPALALDLIEPFRACWADAAVFRLLATNGIAKDQFHSSLTGVYLSPSGRRSVIAAHERRAQESITHPRFGYKMTYRRMLEMEARLLAKLMTGEIEELSPLVTR